MILRTGLLSGVAVVVASVEGGGLFGTAAGEECGGLDASVSSMFVDPFGDDSDAVSCGVLVWDGAAAFAAHSGVASVRAALDGAWLAIRAGIDVESGPQKIVLIAPPAGDAHAEAARAGMENIARTLSIEWARHGIGITTILPGSPEDAAQLVAYLASPAGDYFSGTAISLR